MPTYTAGCHCGRIRFEVDGAIEGVEVCNCSICERTGYVHWYVDPAQVRLLTADGDWTTYRFGTGAAEHRFCPTCGISPFRVARSDPNQLDVNLRCVEGVDADAVPHGLFDGRNWEESYRRLREGGDG